jgi:hypothetical protein
MKLATFRDEGYGFPIKLKPVSAGGGCSKIVNFPLLGVPTN